MLKHKTGQRPRDEMGRFGRRKTKPSETDSPLSPPTRDVTYRRASSLDPLPYQLPSQQRRELPIDTRGHKPAPKKTAAPSKPAGTTGTTGKTTLLHHAEPHPQIQISDYSEVEKLRTALTDAYNNNDALRSTTSRLLEENLQLKERVEALEATAKTSPEEDELAHLLHVLERENAMLRQHFASERTNWLEIKAAQAADRSQLTEALSKCESEKAELASLVSTAQANWDTAAVRIHVLEDELREVVPMERHREAFRRAERLLSELRAGYKSDLAQLTQSLNQSRSELRDLSSRLALAESRCLEAEREAETKEAAAETLRRQLEMARLTLEEVKEEKRAAERELLKLTAAVKKQRQRNE